MQFVQLLFIHIEMQIELAKKNYIKRAIEIVKNFNFNVDIEINDPDC